MQTTIDLKDELLVRAMMIAESQDAREVIQLALRAFIARENARQIIALGGSDPDAKGAPRRRPPNFINDESDYGR